MHAESNSYRAKGREAEAHVIQILSRFDDVHEGLKAFKLTK